MELTKIKFKNSYYGLIPEDWIDCEFKDVLEGFSSGMTPYRGVPEYYRGNIPWITSGELNYNRVVDTIEKITPEAVSKTNLKILPVGTFLMAITGLEAAGTRGSCAITGVKATTNQSCMALYPQKGKTITEYLYHFYVHRGDELAFKFCQGSKQQSYTGRIAKLLPIILPPTLEEQKAIATALSDVDELISNLVQLITKKKAIKQGAMQQLLTPPHKGGKRLAGFTGEWVEKVVGSIGNTYGGLSGKSKRDFENGEYPYITFLNVMNNTEIDTSIFGYVHIKPGEQQNKARKGDLFLNTSSETPEEVGMCAVLNNDIENLYLNSFCFGFRLKEDCKVDALFFSYLINSSIGRKLFQSLAQGATRYNLSKSNFNKLIIEIPTLEEQHAIAQILSDIDLDLEQLETKKAKYQDIKQGMMQELLTGKTRLV